MRCIESKQYPAMLQILLLHMNTEIQQLLVDLDGHEILFQEQVQRQMPEYSIAP